MYLKANRFSLLLKKGEQDDWYTIGVGNGECH